MSSQDKPSLIARLKRFWQKKRARTPTVIQMEAVECGAAALRIVLGYYGLFVPLEELRIECGVSRDGSRASNILKAARKYGMEAKGYRKEPQTLRDLTFPVIVFWNFNHFLVVEGMSKSKVFLNDPAVGPRRVTHEEFDRSFTGVAMSIKPGPDFKKGGAKSTLIPSLRKRLAGSEAAVLYVALASLGVVFTGLIIPTFSRVFVDNILIGGQNWIAPLLIGMAVTALLRAVLTWLQRFFLLRLQTKLAVGMSSKFFWHVLSLPVEFFNQRYAGEVGGRVALNDKVARLLSGDLATTVLNILLLIFYVALMLQYDVVLTIVGVSIALLNFIALRLISRSRVDANMGLLQETGKLIGTTFSGLKIIETLKASGAETDFFSRWAGYQAKTLNAQQQLGLSNLFLTAIPTLLTALNTLVILVLGSLRVMDNQITMGMLVAFQSLMASFLGPVNQLVQLGGTIQEVEGDMGRLDDILRYKPDKYAYSGFPTRKQRERPSAKLIGHLELRDVTFGYNPLAPPLIEDLNLDLKPGWRVALVGATGSGKSTVAKLVAGLYQPWSGEVLFDGWPRDEISPVLVHNSMAMVDQDIVLFEGTIRENLTLWDSSVPDVNVIRAAQDAGIHDDIAARPGGYDALLEEDGQNFSGGQRQRLEIARALVSEPTILVLDEATSALDPLTEQIIDENLRHRGGTCLIVAHRLSTIRDCDEIIVLDDGKVVQRGTHDELMKTDGLYGQLMASEEYDAQKSRLDSILEAL
jgi:NHLM bacteriocin system ABC transporter peptidase/ATP-binding protein